MMIIIIIICKLKLEYRVMRYAEFTKAFLIVKYQRFLRYTCKCNSIYASNECSDFSVVKINTKHTDIQLHYMQICHSILQTSWLINFESAYNNLLCL